MRSKAREHYSRMSRMSIARMQNETEIRDSILIKETEMVKS
jgi:hypothetical protein